MEFNNNIKLIKHPHKDTQTEQIPTYQQNIRKKLIDKNSPIIQRLKEAEEKTKQLKTLSDDDLIELEFKEEADAIRSKMNAKLDSNLDSIVQDITIMPDSASNTQSKSQKESFVINIPKNINAGLDYIEVVENPKTRDDYNANLEIKTNEIKRIELPRNRQKTTNDPMQKFNNTELKKDEDTFNFKKQPISFDDGKEHYIKIVDRVDKNNDIDLSKQRFNDLLYKSIIGTESIDTFDENTLNEMNKAISITQKKLEEKLRRINASKNANNIIGDKTPNEYAPLKSINEQTTQKVKVPTNFKTDILDSKSSLNSEISHTSLESKPINTYSQHLESSKINDTKIINDIKISHIKENPPNNTNKNNLNININQSRDGFTLPPLSLLNAPPLQKVAIDDSEIDIKVQNLFNKLRVFKIDGDIIRTYSGPVVTTFEFRPAVNVKVSRIQNLQDDLSMALKATSIRIQAPIPGKDVVGIEIPNNKIQTIYLREIFESEAFKNSKANLAIALGKNVIGEPVIEDLSNLPHLLIAGTTGSGKSVGINAMILSLLYKNTPKDLRLIMIDPKFLEFGLYKDIPHLLTPIITDPKKAIIALSKAVDEMNRRYELMDKVKVKTITGYNEYAKQNNEEKLPYIVIIIDEFADLMIMGGREAEQFLISLAGKARASGIHLIIATQRPTVNVVTGLIKGNLPSKISYRVGSKIDSKVILDEVGAEALLGKGDLLFSKTNKIIRLHAPYNDEKEIERIVEFIKSQQEVEYDEFFSLEQKDSTSIQIMPTQISQEKDYVQRAKEIILQTQKTSISYLQRSLGVGFNKAASIVETLQKEGFLSEPNTKGIREILG